MASHVSVPIRIVTDPTALTAGEPVADALGQALDAVLGRAGREVPGVRAGHRIALEEVELTWGGTALDTLDAADRAWAEAVVARAVERAVARFERGRPPRRLPMSDPPVEPLDHARWDPLLRLYEVPGYQGKGRPVKLRARSRDDLWEKRQVDEWMNVSIPDVADMAGMNRLYLQVRKDWNPPQDGAWYGLVWPTGSAYRFWFAKWGTHEYRSIGYSPSLRPVLKNGVWTDEQSEPPAVGAVVLREAVRFATAGLEERVAFVRDRWGDQIGRALTEEARKRHLTDAQIDATVPEAAAAEIRRRATALLPAGGQHRLEWAGEPRFGTYRSTADPRWVHWDGDAVCLPVAEHKIIEVRRDRLTGPSKGPERDPRLRGGRGDAEGGGGGGGTRTGTGRGTGTGTRQGEGAGRGTGLARFPGTGTTTQGTEMCVPFLDEPSVADFDPRDADDVKVLMDEIAAILQVPSCGYPARFCILAAQVVGERTREIATTATFMDAGLTNAPGGNGNLGTVNFDPGQSPAMQFLQRAASAVPRITDLQGLVRQIYHDNREWFDEDHGIDRWTIDFIVEMADTLRASIGYLFAQACRILMMQLLRASRTEILHRLDDVHLVAQIFQAAILPQLVPVVELMRLRDRLASEVQTKVWADVDPYGVARARAGGTGRQYGRLGPYVAPADIVMDSGEITAIRDPRGRTWTKSELDDMIAQRRGLAEEVEPLIKHMEQLPQIVDAMGAGLPAVERELTTILERMKTKNWDIQLEVANDWLYAFKLSRIDSSLPPADASGVEYTLQGLHAMAHQALVPAFEADWNYANGVNHLFGMVGGIESLKSLLELGVLVVASVLCPPLGVGMGIAFAGYHLYEAHEKMGILDALMDPEMVVSRAELEMQLFAAELGFVLSILPAVPGIARSVFKIGAEVAEEGIASGSRLALDMFADETFEAFEIAIQRGLAQSIVKEYVKVELLGRVIGRALKPVLEAREEQLMAEGPVGGADGISRVIAWYHRQGGD